jgi:two-component system NtrC family sensor kinase
MRIHRTLLFRLLALGAGALMLLGIGLVLLYTPLSRALVVESVGTVTRDFHEQNARLFRTTVEHMGERMRTELEDVPYALFGDDREALQAWLTERAAHTEASAVGTTRAFTEYYRRRLDDEIDRSAGEVARRLQRWTAFGLVGLLSVLLTAHGLALYALFLRPIRRLQRATNAIAEGDLSTRVGVVGADEVRGLARSFNAMVEQLEESRDEITEWNRTLERRVNEAREKLVGAEKMASLGRMAGGIAHEFNNMLGGILGVAEEASRDESLEEVRESLGVIARTAARAEIVTGNLLRFARPKPPRPTEMVDLPALLRDAATLVEAEAERRGVTIRIEVDQAPTLRAQPAEIHQVVLNLIVNAIQAMPEGGTLRVNAGEEGDAVSLVVRDEGVGIPPEDLAHVFEPFWTSRRGTDEPGTGLGLAVAYAIVTSQAGTIEIDSEPGRGTTVTVRLPREGGDA